MQNAGIAPLVVCFGGTALSGKSHLSARVANALGWPRAGFGDHVREVVRDSGLQPDRSTLQAVGEHLIRNNPEGFCRAVLAKANWQGGRPAVLDGVRHVAVLELVRRLILPEPCVLVLVTAPESVRSARLSERRRPGELRLEGLSLDDIGRHSTEQEASSQLLAMADVIVQSANSASDRTDAVLSWLREHFPVRK